MTVTVLKPSTALQIVVQNDDVYMDHSLETRDDQAQYDVTFRGVPEGEYQIVVFLFDHDKQVGRLDRTVYKK